MRPHQARMLLVMKEHKWTAQDWSLAAGVARGYVAQVMSGAIADPKEEAWSKLAGAAGTSVQFLRDGVPPMFSPGLPWPRLEALVPALVAVSNIPDVTEEQRARLHDSLMARASVRDYDAATWLAHLVALLLVQEGE